MTTNEIKRLFPNASASTIAANSSVVQDAQCERSPGDEHVGEDAAEGCYQGRYTVRITSYRRRLCDADNVFPKHFLDALVESTLLRGDSPKEIDLEVVQQRVNDPWDERTEIDISHATIPAIPSGQQSADLHGA
jgi:hypothetical protein